MTACPDCDCDGLSGPTHSDPYWSCSDCGWTEQPDAMYTVSKEFRFEAAHALPHLPEGHKCRNLHGHSYRFEVFCAAETLDARGFVVDYADISRAMRRLVDEWDHAYLAGKNCPYGKGVEASGGRVVWLPETTSAEHLAEWIYEEAENAGLPVSKVVLYETCTSSVTYTL